MTILPSLTSGSKKLRRVNPIGMRVVVRLRKDTNQTEAGLYLPEGAKDTTLESGLGEVVEVASAVDEDTSEEANISGIPLGATVIFKKNSGVKVPWDDELRIIDTKEILGIVFEIEVS